MRVAIAAGGTGGHFYPGLAAAKELQRLGHEVFFLVRTDDFVVPLLERERIAFRTIPAAGFKRRLSAGTLVSFVKLAAGLGKSLWVTARERPDALLAMGGYLSVPPALAARLFKVPVVLHEQNAVPGWANRVLARLAARVAISFDASRPHFRGETVLTGNPVRPEFASLPEPRAAREQFGLRPDKTTLLVFGGSLGAKGVNGLVVEALRKMESGGRQVQVIHVTGGADIERTRGLYEGLRLERWIAPYCHEMPAAYAASDFVISRAGASTVSELMAVKKPALLIPYPFATEGHQTANARVLADMGAAEVREEKDLTGPVLADLLSRLLDPARLTELAGAASRSPRDPFDAAGRLARLVAGPYSEK